MALGKRNKFFPDYFLMCFSKEMLTIARTLNVEFIWFFSVLASATDVLCQQGSHGLASSVALRGSWSDLVCVPFPKEMCSFALEENPSGRIVHR